MAQLPAFRVSREHELEAQSCQEAGQAEQRPIESQNPPIGQIAFVPSETWWQAIKAVFSGDDATAAAGHK